MEAPSGFFLLRFWLLPALLLLPAELDAFQPKHKSTHRTRRTTPSSSPTVSWISVPEEENQFDHRLSREDPPPAWLYCIQMLNQILLSKTITPCHRETWDAHGWAAWMRCTIPPIMEVENSTNAKHVDGTVPPNGSGSITFGGVPLR
jgi:hypothetical protein